MRFAISLLGHLISPAGPRMCDSSAKRLAPCPCPSRPSPHREERLLPPW